MNKTTPKHKKTASGLRLRFGALISSCLVGALIVIAGSMLWLDGQGPSAPMPDESSVAIVEETPSDEAVVNDEADESDNVVVASNGARYEKNKVLLSVNEGMSADDVNAILADYDFVKTKDVSDQRLSRGFVEVEISSDIEVPTAAIYLSSSGLHTQPNYIYSVADEEEENLFAEAVSIDDAQRLEQWALNSIDAYKAWGIQKAGDTNISVAVIDTGYKNDHEDLEPNVVATYNSSEESTDKAQADDTHGHGTHVAGIVSARANNGVGVAGVSYNANLVIIKATQTEGEDDFQTTTIANGIDWLLSDDDGNGRTVAEEHNVRVINMSVGAPKALNPDDDIYKNIRRAHDNNILSVCAAGNDGINGAYANIPGDYEKCLTVINLQHNVEGVANDASGTYNVTRFAGSNYNIEGRRDNTISAPGTAILSTVKSSTSAYGSKTGTSMAAPCVAGVAALVMANKPSLSAQQTRDLLEHTAADINTPGWDNETGYGEVDAYAALQITSARISQASVAFKDSEQLTLEAADGSAISSDGWTWESDNPEIVSVDKNTGVITGNLRGRAKITATYTKVGGIVTEGYITVDPINLSLVTVSPIDAQTFTGSGLEPQLSVTYKEQELVAGSDYAVTYSNNVNVGTATATVTGGSNGDFANSVTASFDIVQADISGASIEPLPAQVFTGSAVTPSPTVLFNGKKLAENVDYTLSYENNTEKGDNARVIVNGMGNFFGQVSASFSISSVDISAASITGVATNLTYTGSELTPKPTVTYDGEVLHEGEDYNCVYANNVNAGTATLTIKGAGQYVGEKSTTFPIGKANINAASVSGIPSSMDHTGSALRPTAVVTHNGKTLKTGSDYTYSYQNNTNVGTASLILNGRGNFTGSQTVNFTIVKSQSSSGSSSSATTTPSNSNNSSSTNNSSSGTSSSSNANNSGSSSSSNNNSSSTYTDTSSDDENTPEAAVNAKGTWEKSGSMWKYKYDVTTYYKTGKRYPSNEFVNIGNATYHFDASGYMQTGWKQIKGHWFYFTGSGIMAKSWTKVGNTWYHLGTDGRMLKNKWKTEGNKTYYFTSSGAMATGWQKADGDWYYFTGSGIMSKGWLKLGSTWYHLGSDGAMITGLKNEGNATYFFNDSGAMVTGWQKVGSTWYYFTGSGAAAKGWLRSGGAWYYLDYEGEMLVGWQTIDGTRYYLTSSGAMATGWQLVDGIWYYFNGSGKALTGWQYLGGAWYYFAGDGKMQTGFQDISGARYYMNGSGAMVTGWQYINGAWYYFNSSGAMVKNAWIGKYWLGSDGKMATDAWVDNDRYYVDINGVWSSSR